jgi:hypothetical protein
MTRLGVRICRDCPGKTGATPDDIDALVDRQEALGNNVELSRCLGVCARMGQEFPNGSIAGVEISGITKRDGNLDRAPALAGRNSDGAVVVRLIPTAGEG